MSGKVAGNVPIAGRIVIGLLLFSAFAHSLSAQTIEMTDEEQAWLREHRTIRIGGPKAFPPFHYFEEDGTLNGATVGYIQHISERLGIKMEIQGNLTWPQVLSRAQSKEIDLISFVAKSPGRENYLNFTQSYLSFPLVVITRENSAFIASEKDLGGKRVAVIKKVSTFDWLKRDQVEIIPYFVNTPLEALRAVSTGQADAHISNLAAASFIIEKEAFANLKVSAPTTYDNYNVYIGIRKDWPELVNLINKALNTITPEEHAEIRKKWLSVQYEHGIRPIDVLLWVAGISMPILMIMLIVITWNRKLRIEIFRREQIEAELVNTKKLFESAIEQSPIPMLITDHDAMIMIYNQACVKQLRWENQSEIRPGANFSSMKKDWRIYDMDGSRVQESALPILRALKGEITKNFETRIVRGDGSQGWQIVNASPIYDDGNTIIAGIVIFHDITDLKLAQAQLHQSQKMEAVGTLAGGIAHDFNNLLAPIQGYAELAKRRLDPDSKEIQYLDNILKATGRSKDLVKKLLFITRTSPDETVPVQLEALVEEVLTVLQASIPPSIDIRQEIESDLPPISAEVSQIHQVFLNLCNNAVQAMQDGGVLWIRLSRLNPQLPNDQNQNTEDKFVCLGIQDTGCGMDAATLEQIFEPFFTTKGKGEHRGTGLGLSIVSSVVKQHKGHLDVESNPGTGTHFRVYFPIAILKKTLSPKEIEPPTLSGHESILFVDDEKMVNEMGASVLESLGYRVTSVTDSREAVRVFESNPQDFQLVITDYSMPHLTGPQLMKRMKTIRPSIPVLLVTGYANLATPEKIHEWRCDGIVTKPYEINKLSQTVRHLLAKNRTSSPDPN